MGENERKMVVDYLNAFALLHGEFHIGPGAVTFRRQAIRVVVTDDMLTTLFEVTKKSMHTDHTRRKAVAKAQLAFAELDEMVLDKAVDNVQVGRARDEKESA